MNVSFVRWRGVHLKNLVRQFISLVLAVVATKLYTEQQTVYAFIYSLREFVDSLVSKV